MRKYPNAGYSSYIKRGIRCRIYCYPVDIGNDYLIQKLKKRSLSIEKRFIDNFNGKTNGSNIESPLTDKILESLPFNDLHLIDFTVDQASSLVGRSLKEVNFRQQYGINVVSIIRGEQQINIPKGEERLYPFDKIIIVGTDEELDIFQGIMQNRKKNIEIG